MKYAYKTELKPTPEQIVKIHESINICRYLYNQYILMNRKLYKMYQRGLLDEKQAYFMTAKDFDKYINNKVKVKEQFKWINNCGSKARKKSVENAERAFKRYFAGKSGLPKCKRKDDESMALYFPKNNLSDWTIERHRIKIPTLGFVRIKEFGYLPVAEKVINGNVTYKAGRYYVSITVGKTDGKINQSDKLEKIFAVKLEINLNTSELDKKIQFEQEILKKKTRNSINYAKQKLKIEKLQQRLIFKEIDYINKIIAEIIMQKPTQIIFPDLNNKKYTANIVLLHKLYRLRNKLILKCNQQKINLRYVNNLEDYIVNEKIKIIIVKIY